MANLKGGQLSGSDIDALWSALRPRIIGNATGTGTGSSTPGPTGPAGAKGIAWRGLWAVDSEYEVGDLVYQPNPSGGAEHPGGLNFVYICIEAHDAVTAPPVGGNTQWYELSPPYLPIDGSKTMTGDLEMGTHEIDDIKSARFSGAVGEGLIDLPRVIHMAGDHTDDEAKVDGLERVVFNDEPTASSIEVVSRIETNTGVEAGVDYTAAEGTVSWDTLEDVLIAYVASGSGVVVLALGWAATIAMNGAA